LILFNNGLVVKPEFMDAIYDIEMQVNVVSTGD